MDIKNIVMKVRKNAKLLGWKTSDGSIHAFYFNDKEYRGVLVAVDYNSNKISKKKATEIGRKIFGRRFMDVIDTSKPYFMVAEA